MSTECDFFKGEGKDFCCHRVRALHQFRDHLGLGEGELTALAPTLCKEEDNEQRRKDCKAFANLEEYGARSEFAKPL